MLTPILVHGLTTKLLITFDLYTLRFCSFHVHCKNQAEILLNAHVVSHLFLNNILISGLDHCAINNPPLFPCPGSPGDSSIAISIPGISPPKSAHCVNVYGYACRFPLMSPFTQVSVVEKSLSQVFGNCAEVTEYPVLLCP